MQSGFGAAVRRIEDPPLLRGTASYTDDLKVEGALHAAFVRAEVAHASVGRINTAQAKEALGVVGVFTADDFELNPLPLGSMGPPLPASTVRPVLATDRVRFIGEAVAVVVAESRAQAVDAAEFVAVDYEPLDVVVDRERAALDGAILLFPEVGSNIVATGESGEDALDGAEVIVRGRFINQRLAAVPIEPSTALAAPDPETGGVTVWAPLQAPHSAKLIVVACTGIDEDKVRVIAPAVGGAFGARINIYPEAVVLAALANQLDRPVRYVESRWETMVAMQHGRAQIQDVELGATRHGKVTGLKARVLADCGAYPGEAALMPVVTGLMLSGPYNIPKIDYSYRCVVTNTTPIGAYRGAGRPEATALLERVLDLLAHELGLDPVEVRRRNFIQPDEFPHATVTGANYDTGDYEMALNKLLEAAGYEQLRAEQATRRERNDHVQIGIGLCSYVEFTGFGSEFGTCTVDTYGKVTVTSGTSPQGQGHVTVWTQLVASELGVDPGDVTVIQSDTKLVARGMGTMGSRSLQVGGTAVVNASRAVLDKGKRIAAHLLEASPHDIVVFPGDGLGVAGTPGTVIPWSQLASTAQDQLPEGMEPGLEASNDFETPDATYPFGAHLAVVEVDLETGAAKYMRHVSVDDAGRIANPLLVEGQVHGGIAQGAAQALFEEISYDEDGNCITGSLASYTLPSAGDLPAYETQRTVTPTPRNPLGVKGIGEAGTIGSTPAVQNAVIDAVSYLGVRHIDMPASPMRVWTAIREASAPAPPSNPAMPDVRSS